MADEINESYFDSLIERINSSKTLNELEATAEKTMATVNTQLQAINAQIEKLAPLAAMIASLPTTPDEVIQWITDLATNLIEPLVLPLVALAAQQTGITAKIAQLEAAIQAKADELTLGEP